MTRHTRARLAFAVLIGLIVFLLGSLYTEAKRRDEAVDALQKTNQVVVDKLAEVLERTIRAEQAALTADQTPPVRVEDILEGVKGIDQALIDQALQKAYKAVATTPGPAGPSGVPGPPGPPGPAGTTSTSAAPTSTSTTAGPGGTTSTTRSAPSTTTSSTTTTTTRPCTLGLLGSGLLR